MTRTSAKHTTSISQNTMPYYKPRTERALYVTGALAKTFWQLTTTMLRAKCEDCCARTVTGPSAGSGTPQNGSGEQPTT